MCELLDAELAKSLRSLSAAANDSAAAVPPARVKVAEVLLGRCAVPRQLCDQFLLGLLHLSSHGSVDEFQSSQLPRRIVWKLLVLKPAFACTVAVK
jgi:hypothetical protein